MRWLGRAVQWLALALIGLYRRGISPWLGPHCRYQPSCSQYAAEAIERHGPWRGGWLALGRLLRCHPWGGWGPDPVPAPPEHSANTAR
ncbi:MAG: membrane protein insertion efficiency factor YidD [Planctomycetota bacterium]|nr:MAG: membrane protein insertion efficiency factor YidD [Planctomycetota bacterium]